VLAPGVEGVVDDQLGVELFVVVGVDVVEALCDGLQAG
jgi:hypothetical protein